MVVTSCEDLTDVVFRIGDQLQPMEVGSWCSNMFENKDSNSIPEVCSLMACL